MATPRQNFLNQLRAYAQPTPVYTPADIPASVRTYSVFDPSSNTWRRMTNDGRSPIPAQGQTIVPVQGMGQGQPVEVHPGYLNPPAQTPAQMPSRGSRTPSQPLPREGAVLVQGQPANESVAEAMSLRGPSTDASSISLNPNLNYPFRSNFENFQREIPRSNVPVNLDRTQNIPSEYDGEIRNLNNVPTSSGVVGQPVVNVDPADIGQSVPIREATPRLNLNGYTPPTQGEVNLGRALGSAATAAAIPAITGAALMYGPALAGSALNLGRTALTGGLGAAAKVLPKNMTSKVSSWANSAVDASKSLFNKLGGFLQRPAPTVQTYTKVRPTHRMVNPNVRRSANYYGH